MKMLFLNRELYLTLTWGLVVLAPVAALNHFAGAVMATLLAIVAGYLYSRSIPAEMVRMTRDEYDKMVAEEEAKREEEDERAG